VLGFKLHLLLDRLLQLLGSLIKLIFNPPRQDSSNDLSKPSIFVHNQSSGDQLMAALSIQVPYPVFYDRDGQPLDNGNIYIGEANLDPITNPLVVYYDQALTIVASQPIKTSNGYIYRNGTPAQLYVNAANFSITVNDSKNLLVYSFPDGTGINFANADSIQYDPPFTGAVTSGYTVEDKLTQYVSVKDFGAVGDGVTDDTVAFLAAMTAAPNIYVPEGIYCVDAGNSSGCLITSGTGYNVYGDGEKSIIKRFSYNPASSCINFDSGSSSAFIDDVKFSNLKFLGDVATLGHDETYGHLLRMNGVRRAVVEKCYFEGPGGDAILIGSGPGGALSERHNFDIVIRDCVFNGVLYGVTGGRNAISVIDVDGILIEGNSFRDWSRDDMPGTIDFEPNYSFGVVKNVRVANNKFTNTAGTGGHVVFACDNIPTANQQNWVVTGNEFSGATGTSGAAVYLLTEKVTPSVPSTAGQNIIVSNNTATNCNWFVDKFKGSVNGITISNNVVNSSGVNQGAIRFADGTANYTLTDAIISNNQFVTTINIPVAVNDNMVNFVFSNNIMRGATQAHTRLGITGSSTTNVSILNNVFLGTPTNGDCQFDASTANAGTNVYRGNISPAGQSTRFRAFLTDNAGNNSNQYTETALPSSFPRGISATRLSSRPVIGASDSGMIYTFRQSDTDTTVYQVFVIQYSATDLDDIYFRKAVDASNWAAWFRVTGV
jgi:hypothetical protein